MIKNKSIKKNKEIAIYKDSKGNIDFRIDNDKETLWATQAQIAEVFDIDRSVATKHISNIFKDKEVNEKRNVQKMHIANSDKPVNIYSLDIVLAVGYRSNSSKAIRFRQWATKTLKSHVLDGYTINPNRINRNYEAFLIAVEKVKKLLPENDNITNKDTLELVKLFANTWFSLDAYDKSEFTKKSLTKKQVKLDGEELYKAGKNVYESIEEKAAHLLYFIVKNHPFSDGNKRSGAFAFVWFLRKAKILNTTRITPEALTALTLLVAESDPKDKEQIVGLVMMLLGR